MMYMTDVVGFHKYFNMVKENFIVYQVMLITIYLLDNLNHFEFYL